MRANHSHATHAPNVSLTVLDHAASHSSTVAFSGSAFFWFGLVTSTRFAVLSGASVDLMAQRAGGLDAEAIGATVDPSAFGSPIVIALVRLIARVSDDAKPGTIAPQKRQWALLGSPAAVR